MKHFLSIVHIAWAVATRPVPPLAHRNILGMHIILYGLTSYIYTSGPSTAFGQACQRGDVNAVRALLKAKVRIDDELISPVVIVLKAALSERKKASGKDAEYLEILTLLLSSDARIYPSRFRQYSPEFLAVHLGGAFLQLILSHGGNPFLTAEGESLLHAAAKTSDPKNIELIHQYMHLQTTLNGNTSLHLACMKGYAATVASLLKTGFSDPNVVNKSGVTPLYMAVEKGDEALVNMLIKYGAAAGKYIPRVQGLKFALHHGGSVLHLAVAYPFYHENRANLNIVKALIKAGAPLEEINELGETPLVAAFKLARYDVAKILLEHGASFKALKPYLSQRVHEVPKGDHVYTYISKTVPIDEPAVDLIQAILLGETKKVDELLSKGVDPNLQTYMGRSVTAIAISLGDTTIIDSLLKAGGRKDVPDDYGSLPSTPFKAHKAGCLDPASELH